MRVDAIGEDGDNIKKPWRIPFVWWANMFVWGIIGGCFITSTVLADRPAITILNDTGQMWDGVYIRWCWGGGELIEKAVPFGEVVEAGRADCSMGSVDNLWPWESMPFTWGVAIEYPNDPDPVELVYFVSDGSTPWLRFWNIDLVHVVVHEGNRVEIAKRWW